MTGLDGCLAQPLRILPGMWRLFWRAKWLVLAVLALGVAASAARADAWGPRAQGDLAGFSVYSYRQWQSTGIYLQVDDGYVIRAGGEWQYSPFVGMHGPGGGLAGMPAYPVAHAPGGALIGRIGDEGEAFYVGTATRGFAHTAGMLYLRINDDILSDNRGQVAVEIEVTRSGGTEPR